MNIGLYFGSFNPIHHGHLIIANYIATNTTVDQVWMVVSPQNPLKPQSGLANEYHRLHWVRQSIEGAAKLKVSDIEFKLPKPSYTIDTLTYLKEKYPQYTFSIIMGADSFQNLEKWKNYKELILHYKIYIFNRPGFPVTNTIDANIEIINAPLLEISSTVIRKMVAQKKSVKYWLPNEIIEEVENCTLYKAKTL
jgi:nicotinate-nucleotide adenylyltransferase